MRMRLYDREKKKESKLDRESRTARERVCLTVREGECQLKPWCIGV